MTKLATMTVAGKSGPYSFNVYPIDTAFADVGAVYLVTKRTRKADGRMVHDFIYVGETDDLKERFLSHHKEDCFKRNGANCICTHRDSSATSRRKKEADLLANHKTPCNG